MGKLLSEEVSQFVRAERDDPKLSRRMAGPIVANLIQRQRLDHRFQFLGRDHSANLQKVRGQATRPAIGSILVP